MSDSLLDGWPRWIFALLVALAAPLLTTYFVSSRQEAAALQRRGLKRRPPVVPYFLPYIGHGITWVWNLERFVADNVARYGSVPFGVNLGPMRWYIISGSDAIGALLRQSRDITGNASTILAMKNAFGTPPHAIKLYEADDSGLYPLPLEKSSTRPEDRIFYIMHGIVNSYLSGPSLSGITDRYMSTLSDEIADIEQVEDEWVNIPDLYVFLRKHILKSAIRALFGEHILCLNPSIVEDFWIFDKGVLKLFQGIPRWFDPAIYRARENMLNCILRWHEFATANYDCSAESDDKGPDWEPVWGARVMRVRQREFGKMRKLNARARAAEDLGFFWAANANAIPAACWFLIESLSDPGLESQVKAEINSNVVYKSAGLKKADLAKLILSPLLQSMYAETLRLRVDVMIARQPLKDGFTLNGWSFRKEEWIGFMNKVEARDITVWNQGERGERPLTNFWAERFLVFSNDPFSGPIRKEIPYAVTGGPRVGSKKVDRTNSEPRFSIEGLAHTWVPYGGGSRLCPGRHFAKNQIISTTAIWLALSDIEIVMPKDWLPSIDKGFIGFGTIPPEKGIKARIRRKQPTTHDHN